jgi:hypothetical protein
VIAGDQISGHTFASLEAAMISERKVIVSNSAGTGKIAKYLEAEFHNAVAVSADQGRSSCVGSCVSIGCDRVSA